MIGGRVCVRQGTDSLDEARHSRARNAQFGAGWPATKFGKRKGGESRPFRAGRRLAALQRAAAFDRFRPVRRPCIQPPGSTELSGVEASRHAMLVTHGGGAGSAFVPSFRRSFICWPAALPLFRQRDEYPLQNAEGPDDRPAIRPSGRRACAVARARLSLAVGKTAAGQAFSPCRRLKKNKLYACRRPADDFPNRAPSHARAGY